MVIFSFLEDPINGCSRIFLRVFVQNFEEIFLELEGGFQSNFYGRTKGRNRKSSKHWKESVKLEDLELYCISNH